MEFGLTKEQENEAMKIFKKEMSMTEEVKKKKLVPQAEYVVKKRKELWADKEALKKFLERIGMIEASENEEEPKTIVHDFETQENDVDEEAVFLDEGADGVSNDATGIDENEEEGVVESDDENEEEEGVDESDDENEEEGVVESDDENEEEGVVESDDENKDDKMFDLIDDDAVMDLLAEEEDNNFGEIKNQQNPQMNQKQNQQGKQKNQQQNQQDKQKNQQQNQQGKPKNQQQNQQGKPKNQQQNQQQIQQQNQNRQNDQKLIEHIREAEMLTQRALDILLKYSPNETKKEEECEDSDFAKNYEAFYSEEFPKYEHLSSVYEKEELIKLKWSQLSDEQKRKYRLV